MELLSNSRFIDLTGKNFHRLTIIELSHKKNNRYFWRCKCQCGNEINVSRDHLINNHTKSCGCLKTSRNNKSRTLEYKSWYDMINRCYNPKRLKYKIYGARGIKVCNRWLNSFEDFLIDMGTKPSPQHTLERINNNDNYKKSNCKWALPSEQANNRRTNINITINKETKTLMQWTKQFNMSYKTIYARIKANWDPIRALTKPIRHITHK